LLLLVMGLFTRRSRPALSVGMKVGSTVFITCWLLARRDMPVPGANLGPAALDGGLSPRSVATYHTVPHGIFKPAVWDRSAPTTRARPPTKPRSSRRGHGSSDWRGIVRWLPLGLTGRVRPARCSSRRRHQHDRTTHVLSS
jgi:hypothetical protein